MNSRTPRGYLSPEDRAAMKAALTRARAVLAAMTPEERRAFEAECYTEATTKEQRDSIEENEAASRTKPSPELMEKLGDGLKLVQAKLAEMTPEERCAFDAQSYEDSNKSV